MSPSPSVWCHSCHRIFWRRRTETVRHYLHFNTQRFIHRLASICQFRSVCALLDKIRSVWISVSVHTMIFHHYCRNVQLRRYTRAYVMQQACVCWICARFRSVLYFTYVVATASFATIRNYCCDCLLLAQQPNHASHGKIGIIVRKISILFLFSIICEICIRFDGVRLSTQSGRKAASRANSESEVKSERVAQLQ